MTRVLETASLNDQVWYLLLYYGVPTGSLCGSTMDHFAVINKACRKMEIEVAPVSLVVESGQMTQDRYLFRFPDCQRNDRRAERIAEAFECALSITGIPLVERYHEGYVLPVPTPMIKHGGHLLLDELEALNTGKSFDNPRSAIGSFYTTVHELHESAWRTLPHLLNDEDLFAAAIFLKASLDDFYISPGEIREVLTNHHSVPELRRDQTRFETALHNAFKAIEAVIGDPPKDDEKLFKKLQDRGLDPRELVGYETRQELHAAIRLMSRARDKKSAHGSTPKKNREITLGELFLHQSCALYVVTSACNKRIECSL